jgi:hypothetical protein
MSNCKKAKTPKEMPRAVVDDSLLKTPKKGDADRDPSVLGLARLLNSI